MSTSDTLLNLSLSIFLMTPLILLSWWIIRKTPLTGLSQVEQFRAYRIRIGAGTMILIGAGMILFSLLNLIASLF